MADASLGTAVLRTRLDNSGLRTGLNRAQSDVQSGTRGMSANLNQLTTGLIAAGGAFFAARGLINGAQTFATEAERAANAAIIFSKQVARSGVDMEGAAGVVDRLSERFGVLPQTVQESVTLLLRAGGSLEDAERLMTAAGASAAAVGFDIATAFDNATTAVATGRSELLETSGIIANLGPVTAAYAKSLGKTVEELTEAEVVQARVNAIYEESKAEIEDVDQLLSGLVGTQSKVRTETAELRQEFGQRFLPIVKAVGDGIATAARWFNDLPQPIQTAVTALIGFGAAGATLLTTAAGLKVALVALGPAMAGVRAAMLPFLGPIGALALLATGFYAVWTAMDTGRAARAEVERSFNTLIGKMQQYRGELQVTSEAERAAAVASLERQRVALETNLAMTEARLASEREFVRQYEERSFLGQIVSGDSLAADAAARSAEQLGGQVEQLRGQIAEVDQQLERTRTLTIAPEVTVPDPTETGAGYDSLGIPKDGSAREVTIEVTVRNAETAQGLFDALSTEGTAIGRAVTRLGSGPEQVLEGLVRKAELFQTAMLRAWEIPDLTASQFDYLVQRAAELEESAEAFQHALSVSTITGPDGTGGALPDDGLDSGPVTSLYQRVLMVGQARFQELDRALLDALDDPPPPTLNESVRANARVRFAAIDRALIAELEASRRSLAITPTASENFGPVFRDGSRENRTFDLETERFLRVAEAMDLTTTNADRAAEAEARLAREREEGIRAGEEAARAEELRWRDITAAVRFGGAAAVTYTNQVQLQAEAISLAAERGITLTQALKQLNVQRDLEAQKVLRVTDIMQGRESGGVFSPDNPNFLRDAGEGARQSAQDAADRFATTVVNAGFAMGDAAIQAIKDGDIAGLIRSGLSSASSIVGAASFNPIPFLGGSINPAILISGVLGLFGSLFGLAGSQGQEAQRASGAATRGAPAVELNLVINQSLNVQSLTDTASRNAVNGLLDQTVRRLEDAIVRNIIPRVTRLEGAA